MTNKHIINGVDVSGCGYFDDNECIISGLGINDAILYCHCKSNPNCYYKQRKAKEQEIYKLKAENEKLEEQLELNTANAVVIDMAQRLYKLKQALAKIRGIAETCSFTDSGELSLSRIEQIIQEVSEAVPDEKV